MENQPDTGDEAPGFLILVSINQSKKCKEYEVQVMNVYSTFLVKPDDEEFFLSLLPSNYETQKKNTFLIGAATKEGQACGVIWLEKEGIRLRVLHMETAAAYRKQGVASQLLDDLSASTRMMSQPTPITAVFSRTEEQEDFYRLLFYRREVVTSLDFRVYHIPPVCRADSVYYQKLCSGKVCADLFWELDAQARNQFLCNLDREDQEMLNSIPDRDFCRDMCFSCLTPEGIRSAVFFTRTGPKKIELSFLYTCQGKAAGEDLTRLMKSAAVVIEREYKDCDLDIFAQEERVRRLVRQIFPKGVSHIDRIRADWVLGGTANEYL